MAAVEAGSYPRSANRDFAASLMRSRLDVVSAGLSSRIGARHASAWQWAKRLITIKYRGDATPIHPQTLRPILQPKFPFILENLFIYNVLRHMLAPKAAFTGIGLFRQGI